MRISLCTVCRNRAGHYKETILRNIADNQLDEEVEFLLLDYNSDDDLEDWVKTNLMEYMDSGRLTYYKTFDPKYFHRSHSRNMAFRLAKGELVCNVDADNFIGPGFVRYLLDAFTAEPEIFVCAGGEYDDLSCSDIGGRICFRASDFKKLGGYDEAMRNYGCEDYDFIHRLEQLPLKKILIKEDQYLRAIKHNRLGRITEEFAFKHIHRVMVHYESPLLSKMLLWFSDDTYAFGTFFKIGNGQHKHTSGVFVLNEDGESISLVEKEWEKGRIAQINNTTWLLKSNNGLIQNLTFDQTINHYLFANGPDIIRFHPFDNPIRIEEAVLFYAMMDNMIKMKQNRATRILNPNPHPEGAGRVYKNFDYSNPIDL